MFEQFGTSDEQKQEFILGGFEGRRRTAFGLTEPDHGSDATHMETRAVRETRDGVDGWRIDGAKMRSEEHTSELQSLMRISYAVFCLKKQNKTRTAEQVST